ncbi:MAG: protein adenylyltransferase SelO family protein [Enterobacterales bacterium]|nr:protein adenylyltransferase SelO family protein [Enterobacterales bacterium]
MLLFENQFVNQLPGDHSLDNRPRKTRQSCYSLTLPSSTKKPQLVAVSKQLAEQFGLFNTDIDSDWFLKMMSGNQVDEGMQPYAMCYGGHQFGHWAGQLGDGRAINLGEVVDDLGIWQTLQLKGAGMTPYSRSADGLAVLRSSIREFLCSEAMHHLGVPTTRALSLCLTGDKVVRDMFYDGRAKREPGAVVCRVAPSFLRFGNFQLHAARNELDLLKQLLDFCISQYFPQLGKPCVETYQLWFGLCLPINL